MRCRNRIITLLLAAFIFACAKPPVTPPAERGVEILERAEQLYRSGDYEAALKAYETYLFHYPRQRSAPEAINRQGEIYVILGKTEKAKSAYQRIIEEYPDSPHIINAMLGLIRSFIQEGDYQQAVRIASEIDDSRLSGSQTYELFHLLGDAYEKLKDLERAVHYYSLALKSASDNEKADIGKRLLAVTELLSPETISSLLEQTDDEEIKGYLSFQQIQNRIRQEKHREAIGLISDFIKTYPDHPLTSNAAQLKDELEERLKLPVKIPEYRRYTVGCMLPLSGPYEIIGQRALRGIEIATNEFNANKLNPSITVLIKDTGSDPDRALKAVEALNEDEVVAIIGPITTATAVPAAFSAQEQRLPIMTLTQKDDITIIGDYVFRNFLTPRMQMTTLAKYITNKLGIERVAILYPDENYGNVFMNLFWDEIIAHDARVVGVESYDPKSTDFADPIKKLVGLYYEIPEELKPKPPFPSDSDPEFKSQDNPETDEPMPIVDFDAIFIPDAPKKTGMIIPHLVYYDIEDVYLLGTNLWHSEKLIDMAGQYAQGSIITEGFFAASESDKVRDFVSRFQNTYGKQPEFIEAIAYDNAMMLFQAMKNPEIESREMLRDELIKRTDYHGVTGRTSFDENGDAIKQLFLLQLRKDRFVEINRDK